MRCRRLLLGVVLACVTAETGCYHAVVRGGPRSAMHEDSRTAYSLFWGIQDATFDLADCPHGIAYAEVWDPWWGFLPFVITLGIASPKRLHYVCAQPQAAGPAAAAPVPFTAR